MHSAKVAAASPSARQGLVFRGQTDKFSDDYIVQLDSLLLRTSPTARRPLVSRGQTFRGRERLVTIASIS